MVEITVSSGVPESQLNSTFLQGMADRMSVSYFKYGDMKAKPGQVFDHVASIKKRLQMYEETGNTENLMDLANFAMIEFTNPGHENAYFEGTDSDKSPGIKYKGGPWVQKPDF